MELVDVRCEKCDKMLMRIKTTATVELEIKCHRCKAVNVFTIESHEDQNEQALEDISISATYLSAS